MMAEDTHTLSQTEKKIYICKYAKKLNKEDSVDVAKTLIRCGHRNNMKHSADGVRINLDTLPTGIDATKTIENTSSEQVINQLYTQIKYKIEKPKTTKR